MRYPLIALFVLFFVIRNSFGQESGQTGTLPGELSLSIKSISFIKDNEYSLPVIEGYTLLGFFFQPELVYSPSPKVTLRAGTHLLNYSGTGKFAEVRPVFSTAFNISKKSILTIGSLSGSDKHRLFDPHFNTERLYNAYSEEGVQLTNLSNHFSYDTWISWENFIFKGDSTREIFTFGESFRYTSSKIADFIDIEVPVQIQFKHFGGQISNYHEQVETLFNMATGMRVNFDLAEKKYGVAGIEYIQFINNQLNGESPTGISHGKAAWWRLHYTYKTLYIGAAYWKSHNFYAPNGNTIYSSVSDYKPNFVVPERKIISNFFYFKLLPESYLELFLGLDTYYDLDLKRLDSAFTLHLSFARLISLATLKH
jgi:hypothetical protein